MTQDSTTACRDLIKAIDAKTVQIAIMGLGYVGLPLAVSFAMKGYKTTGFDVDPKKVAALNNSESYIKTIPETLISGMVNTGNFKATTDFSKLADMDAILLCVPTPLGENRDPDMSYVIGTTESVAEHIRPGQIVILESTTYPGTTTDVMRPILEKGGLKSGTDFFLAYSPEREDPGRQDFNTSTTPKVVSGDGADALMVADRLYRTIVETVVPVSSTDTAEAVKLTENIFRSVNIALVNELKLIFDGMGIDVWEVIDAAKTKPFGFMPFYPGPGLGGHCIPIDPFYLSWKAKQVGLEARFIELAGEVNTAMPKHVVDTTLSAIKEKTGKAPNQARVLLLGVAYKKNVDDTRESPSLELIELLENQNVAVDFYDPFVPTIPNLRRPGDLSGRASIEWSHDRLKEYDAALISTDHDNVDYQSLVDHCAIVVDTRNATRDCSSPNNNIVRA